MQSIAVEYEFVAALAIHNAPATKVAVKRKGAPIRLLRDHVFTIFDSETTNQALIF
jgi:hypothetical protein